MVDTKSLLSYRKALQKHQWLVTKEFGARADRNSIRKLLTYILANLEEGDWMYRLQYTLIMYNVMRINKKHPVFFSFSYIAI